MNLAEIIKSLKEQAVDKESLANGDEYSIFAHDAQMLHAAADILAMKPRTGHGRWDDSGRYRFSDGSIAVCCTDCGAALHHNDFVKNVWNFCPVCGAKMDEGTVRP